MGKEEFLDIQEMLGGTLGIPASSREGMQTSPKNPQPMYIGKGKI